MDIVNTHGELALLGAIESCRRHQSPQRCLRLSFGQRATEPDVFLQIVTLLDKINADLPNTTLYQCTDGDLFLVGPQFSHKRVALFRDQLLAIPDLKQSNGEVTLHDASFESEALVALLRQKLLGTNPETPSAQGRPQDAPPTAAPTPPPVDDSELIRTIRQRRNRRPDFDILIADDDPFSLRLVQHALKLPCRTITAQSGLEALRAYALHAPDMIFLDIGLPDMTGHEVLRRLLEMDRAADIVMLSGHGDRSNVLTAVQSGARGFVVKPFSTDKLIQYAMKSPHKKGAMNGHRLER